MFSAKPDILRPYRLLRNVSWGLALIMCVGLFMASPWQPRFYAPTVPREDITATSPFTDQNGRTVVPAILSRSDRNLYENIFHAQKKADWEKANGLIARIENRLLLGHVLADRYLHRKYDSKPKELAEWLDHYWDHPQAYDIYTLALAKMPSLKKELPPIRKPVSLSGYGDDTGPTWRTSNTLLARSWHKGLQAWRKGDRKGAGVIFSGIVRSGNSLPPGMLSAASYWAYRAYHAAGDTANATLYLRRATEEPRNFYGILARKQLREPLGLDIKPAGLSESDILEMIGEPPLRRAIALSRINHNELAEKELRVLFPQADQKEKRRLLALAYTLDLASVQITMARQLGHDGEMLDYARYPVPRWEPKGGFTIDPALIYALARQESGFHAAAVSPAGALGVMQLMPTTASFMKKSMEKKSADTSHHTGSVSEPEMNVTLGQNYIKHLLDNALVKNNLFYLLAAYNAGPARLQEWKESIGADDDPLLFLESIPYTETRNYVMQVMANYWIYSEIAGTPSTSVQALLKSQWPSYDEASLRVAVKALAMRRAG